MLFRSFSSGVSTHIDTIICLEGTEIIGAFLAESLGESGINSGADVNVVTPELNAVNQMIFRDNTQKKIWGKQVLLLIASVSTGKSINRAMYCLKYYNGNLVGIASIFSAIKENNGTAIHALFTEKDLPDYCIQVLASSILYIVLGLGFDKAGLKKKFSHLFG